MGNDLHTFDYDTAARDYDRHRQGRGPCFPVLLRLAEASPTGPLLEIGAGTGNNTVAMLEDSGRSMIAVEPSAGMLQVGRAKAERAQWLRGCVEALPVATASVSMLYGTYMLHHVADLGAAFAECHRVLRAGPVAFVTVSHAFIVQHPMNAYFPSFARVDCARFQPVNAVISALRDAGFSAVDAEYTYSEPRRVDREYVEKIASKFISTYALLPAQEFAGGLVRLRRDVEAGGGALDREIVREAVVVYGWKQAV